MGRKMPEPKETTVTVTVVQSGQPEIKLQCPGKKMLHNALQTYMSLVHISCCQMQFLIFLLH